MVLISMTDYLLEQKNIYVNDRETKVNIGLHNYLRTTSKYANFLKKTLELWMFVPCNEDGNVLELENKMVAIDDAESMEKYHAYHKAKSNVIFEGFDLTFNSELDGEKTTRIQYSGIYITFYDDIIKIDEPYKSPIAVQYIEDLTTYRLIIFDKFKNK